MISYLSLSDSLLARDHFDHATSWTTGAHKYSANAVLRNAQTRMFPPALFHRIHVSTMSSSLSLLQPLSSIHEVFKTLLRLPHAVLRPNRVLSLFKTNLSTVGPGLARPPHRVRQCNIQIRAAQSMLRSMAQYQKVWVENKDKLRESAKDQFSVSFGPQVNQSSLLLCVASHEYADLD